MAHETEFNSLELAKQSQSLLPNDVLLLQPWIEDFYTTDCRIQPIGLAFLAGALQSIPGVNPVIIDCLAGGQKKTIPWPKEFQYLKPYYGRAPQGHYALFHQYYRFGLSDTQIIEAIQNYNPLLIGISSLFSPYYKQSLALASLCKQVFPHCPIVMGGNHASLHPSTLLQHCDFVLGGEAEESMVALVRALFNKQDPRTQSIPNLLHSPKQPLPKQWVSPNRAKLPTPVFNGLQAHHYTYNSQKMCFVITGRSCPHRCSFCSIHSVFGYNYEHIPIAQVLQYMQQQYANGIRHFDFEDDNLTYDTTYAMQLFTEIAKQNWTDIECSAMNGLSYVSLTFEMLQSMKHIGFESLNLALVTANPQVRKLSQRPHTLERFHSTLQMASQLQLRVIAYFILGMPGQTVPEMWSTLCELAKGQCLAGASPFYFTPGSPIHKNIYNNMHSNTHNTQSTHATHNTCNDTNQMGIKLASKNKDAYFAARLTAMDVETNDFDRTDIYTLFRMTRVINYCKEGIDKGLLVHHSYFDSVREIIQTGTWPHEPTPFSSKVHQLLQANPIVITGYKTNNTITLCS
jgi:radical SAM superfamily enzyme YgiQ (UPF0313 family)